MCDSEQKQKAADLLNNGFIKDAEPLLRKAVESTKENHTSESFAWMRRLAECLNGQNVRAKYVEAEGLARNACHSFERKYGLDDEDALDCYYLMAESLVGQNKSQEAGHYAEKAFHGFETNLKRGPEHLNTLKCRALIAQIQKSTGKAAEAKQAAEKTLEDFEYRQQRADAIASQGSRRLSVSERLDAVKVLTILGKVLDRDLAAMDLNAMEDSKAVSRCGSKQTAETRTPDTDDEMEELTKS
jgi:tetratricopeptide (TPR) repeat protein